MQASGASWNEYLLKIQKNSLTGEWAKEVVNQLIKEEKEMSSKIKKRSSDVSFSLSRWFRRIQTTAPSTIILVVAFIAYSVFLFGGGLFTIITAPPPAYYSSSGVFYFLYPSISSQFISDTIIACILYALGFAGLFAIYQSTKSAYNPRQAYMMLIIGVTFLLLSYVFLEGSISFKETGTF